VGGRTKFVDSGIVVGMYRITLTQDQHQELQQRTRQAGITPSTRDRLEMVLLSDAGWSIPTIAVHLAQHEQTVRTWVKAFLAGGFDALPNKPRGGGQSALTLELLQTLLTTVAQGQRTWTAGQLADWLATEHGVRLSPGRLRLHLRRAKLSYQRTSHQPHSAAQKHKQDPAAVQDKKTTLTALEKKGRRGSSTCVIWTKPASA
jgi:putative transposase